MKKLLLFMMAFAIINAAQSQSWLIGGNSNINPAIHFLGTTNNQPLKFRINNQFAGQIDSAGFKTFIGYGAGKNTTGGGNAAFGFKALNAAVTGIYNTAIGTNSLFSNTSGYDNTAVGGYTLYNNTTGSLNTAAGYLSLRGNTTGYENTAFGNQTLSANVTGNGNAANGSNALNSNSTGSYNTAIGYYTLSTNTTGNYNTALGSDALQDNTTGVNNTATGGFALYFNSTGHNNTAYGYSALYKNNGHHNNAYGFQSLYSNTTGEYNDAHGTNTLYSNTTGYGNCAFGNIALFSNTTGTVNTALGYWALFQNTTGDHNTAVGVDVMYASISGNYNTAVGGSALAGASNSSYNTAIGFKAGDRSNMGSLNVFVGEESNATVAGLSNVVAVGQGTMVGASNQARFGNSGTTSYGGYANWTNISDGRYKKNIKENVPGLEFINKLRPVTYNLDASGLDAFLHKNNKGELSDEAKSIYKKALVEKEKIVNTGFIAQEVEAAAKELGYDFSGVDAAKNENDVYGLRYAEFVVPLVKAVQEQQQLINDLQKRIAELEKRLGTNNLSPGNGSNALNVWPNPASDNVIININADSKSTAVIKVFDSKGALLKQQQSTILQGSNQISIDTKTLPGGTYLFSAEWNNGQMKKTAQVIKQ